MNGFELNPPRLRRALTLLVALAALLAVLVLGGREQAEANVPILSFSTALTSPQAGGHPDVILRTELQTPQRVNPQPACECNALNSITVQTPPGLVGAPFNTPTCSLSEFATYGCPQDSQIGESVIRLNGPADENGNHWWLGLYNMVPRPGQLALWGQYVPIATFPSIFTGISVRTEDDYGLEFKTNGIPHTYPPSEITLINWGVPAAASHDEVRMPTALPGRHPFSAARGCDKFDPVPMLIEGKDPVAECKAEPGINEVEDPAEAYVPGPRPAKVPAAAYVIAPTTCGGPMRALVETFAYDKEIASRETLMPPMIGCDQLGFDPSLSGKPTTTEADAPSGLDIELKAPQPLSPNSPSASQIRGTTVTLPPGFTINPSAADGKVACTAGEARFHSRDAAECPDHAKIGTLGIESSSLPGVLPGAVYLSEPLPGDRYRVLLVADGFSLHLKLPGTVQPDPLTGRLTMSFKDLPPLPFQTFRLHVFGSERGLLSTPDECGTYPVRTVFEPWDDVLEDQESIQFFSIDSGPGGSPCPGSARPFSPVMAAGVSDATAGVHAPFMAQFTRRDGDQEMSALDVSTPPGFAATLSGVAYCPEAAIARLRGGTYSGAAEMASPACPAASEIGHAMTATGAGTHPVYLPGKVYLAGPYKGAPLSLLVVVPAVSGPYDLGVVAVRAAINVDPLTAEVTTTSDRLPQILEGVPLRTRFVRVALDRPDFALNPTNCSQFSVDALIGGDQGGLSSLTTPFQVANCADLPFEPRLTLRLSGGTNRLGHPALTAVYAAKPGEANAKRISVALPPGEQLDNAHIGNVCTRVQFAADSCPANSVLGSATARTPLLDAPLAGNVYLRSGPHELPDIVVDLRGQIDLVLVGIVDTTGGGSLRTTFGSVPDAPVTSFVLKLSGGKKGLLVNSNSLCAKRKFAKARMLGQNGARHKVKVKLQATCGSKGGRRK